MPALNSTRVVADLHTHSVFSDGCKTPAEIYADACNAGLTHLAVTDHDSLGGSKALIEAASAGTGGVHVIPGVEVSTQHDGRDIHMLGYFVNLGASGLNQMFEENRASREERACKIADNMAEDGYPVSGQAMRDSGKTVNRTLLARMLVESGHAADIDDAYARLIGRRSKYYVENVNFDTVEAVKLILEADGFPFIAHPAQYRVVDRIVPLKREGLVGLEAYHTMHSAEQAERLVMLAEEEGLGVSGGSDWHGDTTHGARLGGSGLDAGNVERFLRVCGRL